VMVMMYCLQVHGVTDRRWCGAESNRRHMDFQSIALPTELPHLVLLAGVPAKATQI
jgi:hypothetical protein